MGITLQHLYTAEVGPSDNRYRLLSLYNVWNDIIEELVLRLGLHHPWSLFTHLLHDVFYTHRVFYTQNGQYVSAVVITAIL